MELHPGYQLVDIPLRGLNKAFTGLASLSDGRMVAVTYRGTMDKPGYASTPFNRTNFGQVYLLDNMSGEPAGVKQTLIADSLLDGMGVCVVEDRIYIGDLNKIIMLQDKDGDGKFETKEVVGEVPAKDGWFEYAFGPIYKDDYLYMALGVHTKQSGEPETPLIEDRGTLIRIPISGGKYEVVAQGIRSPDGIGLGPKDEIFVTDNQGGWRPASSFIHIQEGKHYGYKSLGENITTPITPPSMWLPHGELNNSPTEPVLLKTGQYKGQLLYGDFANQKIFRAFLDPVGDTYQGAVFSFSGGLKYAAHRMVVDEQGVIYVGGIVLNGGTTGPQKLVPKPNAEVFEMLAIRSKKGGLEIEFNQPVGANAANKSLFSLKQWSYTPTISYGGPKQNVMDLTVANLQVSTDSTRVFLEVGNLTAGNVIQISVSDSLKSTKNLSVWSKTGYYTLNTLSDAIPLAPVGKDRRTSVLDLSAQYLDHAIRFTWTGSGYTNLTLRNVKGTLLKSVNVSGRNSISIPIESSSRQLLIVRIEGKSVATTALTLPNL
jgi:hypothetical protein